ncbi:hypothetical protein [Nonomuraea sp. NPDC048826]|uniref:hypothetical protein n=1 Tax=Nonomuraea sp. NPDC048826 TaxID=3364347 RepID=UPI0037149A38
MKACRAGVTPPSCNESPAYRITSDAPVLPSDTETGMADPTQPILSGMVNRPSGGPVTAKYYLYDNTGAPVGSAPLGSRTVNGGERASFQVPANTVQPGSTYKWQMTACVTAPQGEDPGTDPDPDPDPDPTPTPTPDPDPDPDPTPNSPEYSFSFSLPVSRAVGGECHETKLTNNLENAKTTVVRSEPEVTAECSTSPLIGYCALTRFGHHFRGVLKAEFKLSGVKYTVMADHSIVCHTERRFVVEVGWIWHKKNEGIGCRPRRGQLIAHAVSDA